jgi:TolB-like protein
MGLESANMTTSNPADRLDSWKEIATFLRRDVRTVQRWEKKEALPVHRHQHDKLGSVYAFKPELSAWFNGRLQAGAGATTSAQTLAHPSEGPKVKLAVLPFGNLSGQKEDNYFSDGLTEEMITQLTRLEPGRLAVIARATAINYNASAESLQQLKKDLNVDYVLEGKVRRAGKRVRITAQLIDLEEHTHLWAETYERDLSDILTVQAEIAQAFASEINLAVTRSEQSRLVDLQAGSGRVNPVAYESYLKARYHLQGLTPASLKSSIVDFEHAIKEDARYAPAYAGLAYAYGLLAIAPFDLLPPRQAMPQAEAAAKRALELDNSLAEAHSALALVLHHYHWDWAKAESSYKQALECNPDYYVTHLWYSWLLLALGRRKEAFAEIEKAQVTAQETDPERMVTVHATRAAAYYLGREYAEAAEEFGKALQVSPDYFMLHYVLGRASSHGADAHAESKTAAAVAGEIPLMDTAWGLVNAVNGRKDQAEEKIRELETAGKNRYVPATYFGMLYAGLGKKKQAFTWLEKAYEERADGLTWLNVLPALDGLRSEPRFQDLLRRIGFAQSRQS